MRIPHEQLSGAALQAVIEEFITREGTDYGHGEYTLADKCAAVMRQLRAGDAHIDFDPVAQTCTIVPAADPGRDRSGD